MSKHHDPLLSNPLQPQAQLGRLPTPARYLTSQKLRRGYSTCAHNQLACARKAHSAPALWSSHVKKRKKKTIPAKYKEGEEQQTAAAVYDLHTETQTKECVSSPRQPRVSWGNMMQVCQSTDFLGNFFLPRCVKHTCTRVSAGDLWLLSSSIAGGAAGGSASQR